METNTNPAKKESGASCIFCKIVRGEIPCHKVYEDEDFLAFLDIHPKSAGHTQVIPKEHYRWVWEVPNAGKYFEVAQKIAKAEQKAFGQEMIRSQIYGDEVPHAHIWVWPSNENYPDIPKNAENFEENAKKIISML